MKTYLVCAVGILSLIGAGGCSTLTGPADLSQEIPKFTCLSNTPTVRVPVEFRSALPAFGRRTPDDAYVSISNTVPGGFAGLFLEDGKVVLTFVDPARANQSRREIKDAFADQGLAFRGIDIESAEFRAALWTFAELDEWYRFTMPRLNESASGVSLSDIDERANTISFGVIDETARARLESRALALGVPCNLVTTSIVPYPRLTDRALSR